jgi:ribosomal protein S18 acetylase RimI-like enzyme
MSTISLRASTSADAGLYYRVLDETLRNYIVFAWGSFNEERARAEAIKFGLSPDAQVIEVDGTAVGILLVQLEPDQLYLRLLCLLPEAQRLGAGTIAMRQILARAAAARVPVRLRVTASNPVKPFYEKFGFRVVEETPEFCIMEHAA